MSRLVWDKTGERYYETGTDHGVLYPTNDAGQYDTGVAWNGLTAVNESPEGAEANAQYADNIKYLNLYSAEEFKATIEAFTYPDEFAACDGSIAIANGVYAGQQTRRMFAFCYRTRYGNDVLGSDFGYKLHVVYGATAAPSERSYETINDSPEPATLSWEIDTTPVETGIDGLKPTSTITINSWEQDPEKLKALEDVLYGTVDEDPRLPMPDEIVEIIGTEPYVKVEATVAVPQGSTEFLGMEASKLQSNIRIDSANKVTGTSNYVDNYELFSNKAAEKKGNYLAFKVQRDPIDAEVEIELETGTAGKKKMDANDNDIVVRLNDASAPKLKITTTYNGKSVDKVLDLTAVTKAPGAGA